MGSRHECPSDSTGTIAAHSTNVDLSVKFLDLVQLGAPEAAQEGAQGGRRLDRAAQGAGGLAGAQHVGVVDAVAASQRRRNQAYHLVARVRPAWGAAKVEMVADQFGQAQAPGQGGGKDQPRTGHQAVVVEGDLDAVGVVTW